MLVRYCLWNKNIGSLKYFLLLKCYAFTIWYYEKGKEKCSLFNRMCCSKNCLILPMNSQFPQSVKLFFTSIIFSIFICSPKYFTSSMCTFQAPSHNLKWKGNYLRGSGKLPKNQPIKFSLKGDWFQILTSKTLVGSFLSSILLSNMNTNPITEILSPL